MSNTDKRPQFESRALINGEWQQSCSTRSFPVINPADGNVLCEVTDCNKEDTQNAIEAAAQAQTAWQKTTPKDRAALMKKWHTLVIESLDELAQALTLEQGKPLTEAKGEIRYGAAYIEWFAEQAKRIEGEIIAGNKPGQQIQVTKHGVGLCAIATPWNFPNAMIARKLAAALAAGCCCLIKPASKTPLSAALLVKLAAEAGIPDGVISLLPTSQASEVFDELLKDERVRKASFTGSTETGKQLMQSSAATLKRLSLELGGNAPFIVCEDADFMLAADELIKCKFRNAGQTCVCANRVFVHSAVYDSFLALLLERVKKLKVGNGLEDDNDIGPLISSGAIEKVEQHIDDALKHGAKLEFGGQRHEAGKHYFTPTVLSEVTDDMLIFREETFGPVAPLFRFDNVEEVIARANNTEYGLASYVFTKNMARALSLANALEAGMVGINAGLISNEVAPFGGVKASGFGREGSTYGLDDYLELKYTLVSGFDA